MPTHHVMHESVAGVLRSIGHQKVRASGLMRANNAQVLREQDEHATMDVATNGVLVSLRNHPKYSGDASWEAKDAKSGKQVAFEACIKAGGFPIFEKADDGVVCRFTRDAKKATCTDAAGLKKVLEQDETDGTGEPSGDTKTDTIADNKDKVGTKKGTKADNKHPSDENSSEVNESKDGKGKPAVGKDGKPIAAKPINEDAGNNAAAAAGDKRNFTEYPKLVVKLSNAAKAAKTVEEQAEVAKIGEQLDAISEAFYDGLKHPVTIVLYPEGKAEVVGLNEDEVGPFGGTAPMIPARYSKKAKDAGPNSKVDMGVLTLKPKEGMNTQGHEILTGKDFKACGWGTPGKGTGKQGKWSDTGKHAVDSAKKLKAGLEA